MLLFLLCSCISIILLVVYTHSESLRKTVAHFARPIFEPAPEPTSKLIVNKGFQDSSSCSLYGFPVRDTKVESPPRIFDLFLFDHELDLLEIRLHELAHVVDYFVVVDSNLTFTNHIKPNHFELNMARYRKFLKQIIYVPVALSSDPNVETWTRERGTREAAVAVLRQHARPHDLVLFADIDELPRASVFELLKTCAVPSDYYPMMLHARWFQFSFEFADPTGWWTSMLIFQIPSDYDPKSSHSPPPLLLERYVPEKSRFADGGWHCSWCFPLIKDFVHKMQSYSHSEHAAAKYADPARIQQRICDGEDLFDRWGEVHTWRDLARNWDGKFQRQLSIVGLPQYVVESNKYPYLLPGHCQRADFIPPSHDETVAGQ